MQVGDTVVCKHKFSQGDGWHFRCGDKYYIHYIEKIENNTHYYISHYNLEDVKNMMNYGRWFGSIHRFDNYFYTEKELRRKKLESVCK